MSPCPDAQKKRVNLNIDLGRARAAKMISSSNDAIFWHFVTLPFLPPSDGIQNRNSVMSTVRGCAGT